MEACDKKKHPVFAVNYAAFDLSHEAVLLLLLQEAPVAACPPLPAGHSEVNAHRFLQHGQIQDVRENLTSSELLELSLLEFVFQVNFDIFFDVPQEMTVDYPSSICYLSNTGVSLPRLKPALLLHTPITTFFRMRKMKRLEATYEEHIMEVFSNSCPSPTPNFPKAIP